VNDEIHLLDSRLNKSGSVPNGAMANGAFITFESIISNVACSMNIIILFILIWMTD
jgi:hypothetical protein